MFPFMKEKGVMIDLETLGLTYDAAIVSIGAVKFTFEDGILDRFKVNIDAKSAKNLGLKIDPDTIDWWASQKKEARDGWMKNPVDIHEGVNLFLEWWGSRKDLLFWCNGLSFDAPVLITTLTACNQVKPWKYHNEMDLRTVYRMVGVTNRELRENDSEFQYHDSLGDAEAQAKHLISLFNDK